MLTGHRNEDLAEMLKDVEAGANPEALLWTVVGAIIELRKAAHPATVPPTNQTIQTRETMERRKEKRKKRRRQ